MRRATGTGSIGATSKEKPGPFGALARSELSSACPRWSTHGGVQARGGLGPSKASKRKAKDSGKAQHRSNQANRGNRAERGALRRERAERPDAVRAGLAR